MLNFISLPKVNKFSVSGILVRGRWMDGTDGGNTFHELYLQATARLNIKGVGGLVIYQ